MDEGKLSLSVAIAAPLRPLVLASRDNSGTSTAAHMEDFREL